LRGQILALVVRLLAAIMAAIRITLASVVLAYPYIPGCSSKALHWAGLMLFSTHAFREGDYIEINGTIRVVQDLVLASGA
jgi:hypothetical protein